MPPEENVSGARNPRPATGGDSAEVRETLLPVKRERAGLLWRLLPQSFRARTSAHLDREELEALNKAFRSYRARAPERRRMVELSLLAALRATGSLPQIAAGFLGVAGLLLFLLHLLSIPAMDPLTRLTLFIPVLLGAMAPISLLLLPGYRLRALFGAALSPEAAITVGLAFLGLLWTLYFVAMDHASFGRRPAGVSLFVLCWGALTAPLVEEVLFREVVPIQVGSEPYLAGHLVGAGLFSLAHVPADWGQFGLYAVAGLFLSAVRIHTGGLLYPVIIHCAVNLVHQLLL